MAYDFSGMIKEALDLHATRAAMVNVGDIRFSEELRALCGQNVCGRYGSNWMCPPAVGPVKQLKEQAKKYAHGLVFQTVCQLEDSFDFEGMMQGKSAHEEVFRRIRENMTQKHQLTDSLALNAGACEICSRCSYLDGEPCRFPEKAVASVEAYGIDVTALMGMCQIPYNNGKDTVSYVGLILFN